MEIKNISNEIQRNLKWAIEYHTKGLLDAKLTFEVNPCEDTNFNVEYHSRKLDESFKKLELIEKKFSQFSADEKSAEMFRWAIAK